MANRTFFKVIGFALMVFVLSASAGDVPPLEERVRETQLDNGLKVVVVERPNAPVFFSLIAFRVGSSIEDVGKSGLSHFMEHMLFKGTETIGTTDFSKEKPIMEEIEEVATSMRDLRISLEKWRFDIFEKYTAEIKSNLSPEIRQTIQQDEASKWKAILDELPVYFQELPEEMKQTSWLLKERNRDFWKDYRKVLGFRQRISELITEQRKHIQQNELTSIYSAQGSQMLNAGTGYDGTQYMLGLPSNNLELWMFLEADRFKNPVFREFYSEREVIQEELAMYENSPGSFLFQKFVQAAFVSHPYGRPIIGWKEDIQLALRTEMDNHYHRYYGPNNCQMTIVGDVKAEEVFRLAEKYFSSWEMGEVAHEVTIKEEPQTGERRIEVEFKAEPQMIVGWHVPAAPHPDAYALEIMAQVLSSGRTSRFYKSIFEQQQISAGPPRASIGPGNRYPGIFFVFGSPNGAHSNEDLEAAVYIELEKLKTDVVAEREMERIFNNYKSRQLRKLRSNQWLAFSLSRGFTNTGDWSSSIREYQRVLEVTPEDIKRVANKYLTKTNRTVAYLVKPEEHVDNAEPQTGGPGL
ncbi:MAG: insulinase family protein [Calditrichaeota bacterium]|nr:insulinase family protein [Calditrichota bacterium]MBT7790173.1 insulinase family protein [Calditrichota bacterium]